MQTIDTIIPVLARLREGAGQPNMIINATPGSVLVEANRAGLIEFARQIVIVASKGMSGSHQDFDQAGFASKADATLTVALTSQLSSPRITYP